MEGATLQLMLAFGGICGGAGLVTTPLQPRLRCVVFQAGLAWASTQQCTTVSHSPLVLKQPARKAQPLGQLL